MSTVPVVPERVPVPVPDPRALPLVSGTKVKVSSTVYVNLVARSTDHCAGCTDSKYSYVHINSPKSARYQLDLLYYRRYQYLARP